MAAFADLCRFNPTLGGTTDFVYSSAVGGCQSPAAANVQNGVKYKWYAVSADLTQWEVFEGAYNSGTTTAPRTTVLYNSSGTGTATGQSGAGTKINFSTVPQVAVVGIAEDLISVEVANSFTAAQKAQARSNIGAAASGSATLETTPADPAGTVSTTGVMMGLGSTCTLTPTYSGRIKIEFIGMIKNSSVNSTSKARVFFGSGAAPANGAAITGTQIAAAILLDEGTASFNSPFTNGGIITGLTPGTAYWFDLVVATSNAANTATVSNLSCNAFEF